MSDKYRQQDMITVEMPLENIVFVARAFIEMAQRCKGTQGSGMLMDEYLAHARYVLMAVPNTRHNQLKMEIEKYHGGIKSDVSSPPVKAESKGDGNEI